MRRTGVVTLLVVSVLGLAGLTATAASDSDDLAFTLGVVPSIPAGTMKPGETVCQAPIPVPEPFSRIGLTTGGPTGEGQPLAVSVRAANGNQVLGRGRIGGGFPDRADLTTAVGRVDAGRRIAVCARNIGNRAAVVYGNAAAAAPLSEAKLAGRKQATDLAIVFLKADDRSMLSRVPEIFSRASLFRAGWVGSWVFWALAGAVLLGVPLLLSRALAAAGEEAPSEAPEGQTPEPASAP